MIRGEDDICSLKSLHHHLQLVRLARPSSRDNCRNLDNVGIQHSVCNVPVCMQAGTYHFYCRTQSNSGYIIVVVVEF